MPGTETTWRGRRARCLSRCGCLRELLTLLIENAGDVGVVLVVYPLMIGMLWYVAA